MLQPKKVKYRKMQKGKRRKRDVETRGIEIAFGTYALKAMERKWVTARQIEAGRRCIIRYLEKGGKVWVRIFPDKPVTSKGTEVPMGGGKGALDRYVFPVKPGRIIYELAGVDESMAKEAFRKAASKLPIKVKFVKIGQ